MRALVTGAAGFIGSHLTEYLLGSGASVVGVDCFTAYYDPSRKRANLSGATASERFELHEADLCSADPEALVEGVDVIFHLAAQPGVRRSWGSEFEIYLNQNLLATQRLLEAAKGAGVGRFVYASSSSIYGDAETMPTPETAIPRPVSPYGVSKLAMEHLCRLYFTRFEVPVVGLRYFTVFGPRQRPDMAFHRFIEAGIKGREIEVFGDGHQSRDFTFVADAVAATVSAASNGRPGELYNVAGGAQATVLEVIADLRRLLDADIPVRHLPAVPGDARHTGADTRKAQADLSYTAETPLGKGLAQQVETVSTEVGAQGS